MKRHRSTDRPARTWLVVLLAILAALGVVVYWKSTQLPAQPAVEELVAIGERFLQQVREGETEAAWESTTVEFKSAQGKEHFKGYVKSHAVLGKPMEFISAQQVLVQEQPRTELLYREPESGDTIRVLLGHERGKWKVDRLLGVK